MADHHPHSPLIHPGGRRELSPSHLTRVLLPRVRARMRRVCTWRSQLGKDWDLGDYRFLVLSFEREDAHLYIQIWSEPGDPLYLEVSSGAWNTEARTFIRAPQRRQLRALGYSVGGPARNFRKIVPPGSGRDIDLLARECVQILVDVFGYRGTTDLNGHIEAGTNARQASVIDAVTPDDLRKVLVSIGLDVVDDAAEAGEARLVARRAADTEVVVRFLAPGKDGRFGEIVLLRSVDEGAQFGSIEVTGGVTSAYLRRQLNGLVSALLGEVRSAPRSTRPMPKGDRSTPRVNRPRRKTR